MYIFMAKVAQSWTPLKYGNIRILNIEWGKIMDSWNINKGLLRAAETQKLHVCEGRKVIDKPEKYLKENQWNYQNMKSPWKIKAC